MTLGEVQRVLQQLLESRFRSGTWGRSWRVLVETAQHQEKYGAPG